MAKKEIVPIDYSKLTLPEIIRRKTKKKCSFLELEEDDRIGVVDYIKIHNINIKVFGQRWFDIITKKFYVDEYVVTKDSLEVETHSFDTFYEFYTFLKGDIYHDSCFFGYTFNENEIERYLINLDKLNFDSFIVETIDDYSFEELTEISKSQMYVAVDFYFNKTNVSLQCKNYFDSLRDLAGFVHGDFRGADFSKAPIVESDLYGYQINKNTQLPLDKNYSKHVVTKVFSNDEFHVKQSWLDSKDREIKTKKHSFSKFFDFVHFLKKDLSNSDLLMCDGIENIQGLKDLNIQNIKVRSYVSSLLNLPIREIPEGRFVTKEFNETTTYELQTVDSFELQRVDGDDYSDRVSYITDIHLLHRFEAYKCQSYDDITYTIRLLTQILGEQSTSVNLIAGDTSSDFEAFRVFVNSLSLKSRGSYFYVLGNHELWDEKFHYKKLDEVVDEYRKVTTDDENKRFHLVHNNLFYLTDSSWNELSTDELTTISSDELRTKMRESRLIIFGGTGFAGKNMEFNADAGLYRTILSREDEIAESNKFYNLYEKVTESLKGMNLIVLTHMPMRDWGGDIHAKEDVVYVNGHSHRNYFYDDGKKRIYADNQVGYKGKSVNFKTISIDFGYNWFADYKDGIYEITKEDYEKFYRGISEGLTFNREFANLYMIKREETYMFLMRTPKGLLLILNGGSIRKAGNHELEYFYEHLVKYSTSVSMFLSKYDSFQKQISSEIKRIGGNGHIHGSIVDIDFYNHLYLNPLDGTITAYFAYSMVDKYVYDNMPSLLKYECPKLFENYKRLLTQNSSSNSLTIYNKNLPVTKKRTYVDSIEMYKISRILKGLQFTTKYNIVRLWNDNFVAESSEENGRLIVSGIINPDSVPHVIEVKKTPKINKPKQLPKPKIIVSPEELAKKKAEDYKNKTAQETQNIEILEYVNSTTKAKYKCKLCGYEWSTRPDYFKDRQGYSCPKCKR
jgi:hypothetical protein